MTTIVRYSTVALLLTATVTAVVFNTVVRGWEAWVAGPVVSWVTAGGTEVNPEMAIVYFGVGTPDPQGLLVTPECTFVLLFAPLVLLAGVVLLSDRLPLTRTLAGLATGGLVLVAINEIRFGLIGWATQRFGPTGYAWTHSLVGSLLSLVGMALAFGIFLLILRRARNTTRRTET
ncbi:hypothetical protein [Amycolatopsis sp. lyj-108]|uniref:hypothetical protein n=1 Tax=Amycolatopsis sp. lyj-108 TaxID=2789286 RepID=UPI0039781A5F